jgi:hypothetical protein
MPAWLLTSSSTTSEEGAPHHQVTAMDVAIHLNQTYTTLRRLGYGGPRSLPFCSLLCLHFEGRPWCQTTAMSQWRQRQLRESWHDGNGGNANSRNFQRQRLSLSPVSSLVCGLFSVFNNDPLFSTVYIHASLGGGGTIWQPLSVFALLCYWQDANQRQYPGRRQ